MFGRWRKRPQNEPTIVEPAQIWVAMYAASVTAGLNVRGGESPVIPELLSVLQRGSAQIAHGTAWGSCGVTLPCSRYLWGKGIEAAFLSARPHTGQIAITFVPADAASGAIRTLLPPRLDAIVRREMDASTPYLLGSTQALVDHYAAASDPDRQRVREAILDAIPIVAVAHAVRMGYHRERW